VSTITDIYQEVLFNDGEELTFQDQNNIQRFLQTRLSDQLFSHLIPNDTNDPDRADDALGNYFASAYCLTPGGAYLKQGTANNKVKIAAGTLLQALGNVNGSTPQFLAFTFDGTTELTIANGDATNPRVDIIEMKLQEIDTGSTNRLFSQSAVKAILDLSGITGDDDTLFQAKVPGKQGNLISVTMQKRSVGSGVSYSESGNAITILYQDGVSTVLDVENAVVASSTLLEIHTAGTPTHVLHDPTDSFVSQPLVSGSDEILITQTLNKVHRVQCTIQITQGNPAPIPTYPDPSSGFCAIGGVYVAATYSGGTPLVLGVDTAGVCAVLHDQRIPLGMKAYHSFVGDASYNADYGVLSTGTFLSKSNNNAGSRLTFPLRSGTGRLIAVAQGVLDKTTLDARLTRIQLSDSGGGAAQATVVDMATPVALNGTGGDVFKRRSSTNRIFEKTPRFAAGPTILAGGSMGLPLWTNGRRCWTTPLTDGSTGAGVTPVDEYLGLAWQAPGTSDSGSAWGKATFWVAEGL